jgi:hypothetical protein
MNLNWIENRHRMQADGALGKWSYRTGRGSVTFLPKTEKPWSVMWVKMEDGPEKDLFGERHREHEIASCHPKLVEQMVEAFETPNPAVNVAGGDPADILLTKLKFDFAMTGGGRQYSVKSGKHYVSVLLTNTFLAVRVDKRGNWVNMLRVMTAWDGTDDLIPLHWPDNVANPIAVACQFVVDVMIDAIAAETKWEEPR